MGAISLGPALYGAVRGVHDEEKLDMEKRGFDTDQAIRTERLAQERDLAPVRKQALELGVQDAQHTAARRPVQDALQDLNLKDAQLSAKEREELATRAAAARGQQDLLRNGLRDFMASGNPQAVADAFAQTSEKRQGTKAVRRDDGSIEMTNPNSPQPLIFRTVQKDGRTITPDEQLQHFVIQQIDPIASLQREIDTDQKTRIEGAKQGAITSRAESVERIRAEGRASSAEARAARERDRRMASDLKSVQSAVGAGLKTSSIPGHFANTYSSEDDAKLVPTINARAAAIYKEGADEDDMTPAKAAKQAIEETRTNFVGAKKAATDAAGRLLAAGIDPSDRTSLADALKKGNADAKALVEALGNIKTTLGEDAAKYLFDQLPRKKK